MKEIAKQEKQIELEIDDKVFNKFYVDYLFDYSHKIEVHKGSAGSGKSVWVTQKNVLRAMEEKRTVLFIRKVATSHRDSCWQLVLDTLEQFKYLDKVKINKNESRITFSNGSIFLFKGMDDSEKIKSIAGISDIVIEEATELILTDYTQLLLRLRTRLKQPVVYIMFNPISKNNWTFSTFKFSEENQTQPIREYDNVIVFCTTYKDNKFLPQYYIDELENMKYTNYNDYLVYTKGLFISQGQKVFSNWEIKKIDVKELIKQKFELLCGIDAGFVHPYTVCISFLDRENKTIYIYDEMSKSGIVATDTYNWICKNGYSSEEFVMDSAAAGDIETLKRLGLRIKHAKKGKNSVMSGVRSLLNYKIVVNETCPNFIQEISNYSYKKNKNGEFEDEVVRILDDLLDALRYSCEGKLHKRKKGQRIKVRL